MELSKGRVFSFDAMSERNQHYCPPAKEGGERSERVVVFLVLHQFIGRGYQRTTTPVVFDAFPSFAILCWQRRASRRGA